MNRCSDEGHENGDVEDGREWRLPDLLYANDYSNSKNFLILSSSITLSSRHDDDWFYVVSQKT